MSFKDIDEEPIMHSKSDNIEIMINDEADEIIEELFQLLFTKNKIRFETSISYLIVLFIY